MGSLIPGRIHTLILSDSPIGNRKYRKVGNMFVDANLRDVEPHMVELLSKHKFISLKNDNLVTGRSWEMAGYMAAHNSRGVYSGTVEIENGSVKFGDVPGVDIKRKLYGGLITNKNFEK
jgi:hypothetical protein